MSADLIAHSTVTIQLYITRRRESSLGRFDVPDDKSNKRVFFYSFNYLTINCLKNTLILYFHGFFLICLFVFVLNVHSKMTQSSRRLEERLKPLGKLLSLFW